MFRIIPDGKTLCEYALLRDGQSVLLRAATPQDVPAVEALMRSVSRDSLAMRFMGAVSYVSRGVIETFCAGEPGDSLGLMAIMGQGPDSRVVAIGNYISLGVGGKAEVAFLVQDEFQGRGISTLLLERLAGIAAASGFTGFEASVLYENQAMISVFRGSGFEVCQAMDGGSIHVEFPVGGQASLRERVELRDRIAVANSLLPMLQPRAVAVVGASRDPQAVGSMIFRAILLGNFSGTVYPVNGQTPSVHGVKAYPSLRNLPEPADLVVVAVPAGKVLEVAEEAMRSGTKGLLVVASGFAESGPEGAAAQKALVDLVRSHGARLIGPNCLGLMNTHPDVRLNASLAPSLPPRGRIGFFSHSAALGLVILNYAAERDLGFSHFVSAGNRADVSGYDLLQFWEEDPGTDIALLYLETFGNPRRFARAARRISYRKPILCVKSARSKAGRDVARAHIGAVAQSDTNADVLFRQTGVIRAETLEEMFDVATLMAHQPLPRGNRAAVVSNSGGVLTVCADACESHGLVMSGPGVLDLGPLVTVTEYEQAVQRALEHEEVDALIAVYACVGNCDPEMIGRGIRRAAIRAERSTRVSKPVLLCLMGALGAIRVGVEGVGSKTISRHVFPSYRFPESAALALSRAVEYAAFRAQKSGRYLWYDDTDPAAARLEVKALLDARPGDSVLIDGDAAWKLVEFFGIHREVRQEGAAAPQVPIAFLEVVPNPSFGPLVRLGRAGKTPHVRITPLTDNDVRELVSVAGLEGVQGVGDMLGRVSQLIEEVPWLSALYAEIRHVRKLPGGSRVGVEADLKVRLGRHESAHG